MEMEIILLMEEMIPYLPSARGLVAVSCFLRFQDIRGLTKLMLVFNDKRLSIQPHQHQIDNGEERRGYE